MVEDRVEREIMIEAPVAKVWAAVTEAPHLGTWFGNGGATIDLRPGGALTLTWRDGDREDVVHGVVEKVDEPHLFAYRWALSPNVPPAEGHTTLVEFTLHAEGEGTRLTVVESGFTALAATEAEQAEHVADHTAGWRAELAELRTHAQALP